MTNRKDKVKYLKTILKFMIMMIIIINTDVLKRGQTALCDILIIENKRRKQLDMKIFEAKEASRGVFWVIEDKLFAFPFIENSTQGLAKSGLTYNHKNYGKNQA